MGSNPTPSARACSLLFAPVRKTSKQLNKYGHNLYTCLPLSVTIRMALGGKHGVGSGQNGIPIVRPNGVQA